jgi:hypothetical protein
MNKIEGCMFSSVVVIISFGDTCKRSYKDK